MAKVILMSGVSGSGKSTIVDAMTDKDPFVVVCSADDWFLDSKGVYRFNPAELGNAHGECLRKFTNALIGAEKKGTEPTIVVDNTNSTVVELAPYVALAQAYKATIELVNVKCDPKVAHARNSHGVPLQGIKRMAAAIESRRLPPFWTVKVTEIVTS